ncbi:DUF6084 family protein [Streptomyces yaizuensis]|uniref:DUF6084 family protein n=1 Tax=Streptomyces yaizuensis TaxID=2989713 RepID=A0ABQ5NZ21_9ACTN|nr:DUF6084 family protein [Streptomyces sp. YSPA8]GLF95408.1 DUF6084 family protein [Streptomyces sp. YSPA8]
MRELAFRCTEVRADRHAAGPTLVLRLRITAPARTRVHALALRCQLRIEPARRAYDEAEGERLTALFGERSRWGSTLNPIQFAEVPLMVPGFTGESEIDLPVPCTYDLDIAATRYFRALESGDVPLLLLFSGTVFSGPAGFHVTPVPWDLEAAVRLPVKVWREMMEQHFPGCGWVRLPADVLDELLAFRTRRSLPSWESTVRALLGAADTRGTADTTTHAADAGDDPVGGAPGPAGTS